MTAPTDPPPPTLVDFLRARLDEDEAPALALSESDRSWRAEFGKPSVNVGDGFAWACTIPSGTWDCDDPDDDCREFQVAAEAQERHIARHDPARVLAEVAAKRAIVDEHQSEAPEHVYCRICDTLNPWPCWTLRHLAAVYAEHPDYDEAWRP